MNGKALLGLKRIAWAALLWALGNTLYVYLVLGGTRTFRVESAVFLLVAALLPLVWFAPSGSTPAVLTDKASRSLALVAGGLWLVALSPFVTLPFLSDDYVFLASYRSLPDVVNVGHFFRPMFAAASPRPSIHWRTRPLAAGSDVSGVELMRSAPLRLSD